MHRFYKVKSASLWFPGPLSTDHLTGVNKIKIDANHVFNIQFKKNENKRKLISNSNSKTTKHQKTIT